MHFFIESLLLLFGILSIFFIVKIFHLKKEKKEWIAEKEGLQQAWMQEREKRVIAEERGMRIQDLETLLKVKDEGLEKFFKEVTLLKSQLAEKESRLIQQAEHEKEKLILLQQTQEQLTASFKSISSEALHQNIQAFLEMATMRFEKMQDGVKHEWHLRQQTFDNLVKPIQTCLQTVDKRINEIERDRLTAYSSLTEQIHGLAKTHSQLHAETSNLSRALRVPQVRGRWGEIHLRRVVEIAGMVEYCDFLQQECINLEDKRLKPDLTIKLPNSKQVVIDAKAPLQAYLESLEIHNEAEKLAKLKEHARHVRRHINQLAAKSYWEQFKCAPEFVVLFLPGEPFFSAALEHDPELIEWGVQQKVILATPTTLIALLKAVAYGWGQEVMSQNIQKVSELGYALYDRIRILVEHFDEMKKGLDRVIGAYNKAVGSFESRIVTTVRKFKELGVTSQEEIPFLETIDLTTRFAKQIEEKI